MPERGKYTRICKKTHTKYTTNNEYGEICYYHRNKHDMGIRELKSILGRSLVCKGSINHVSYLVMELETIEILEGDNIHYEQ